MKSPLFLLAAALALPVAAHAQSTVPQVMNFQGFAIDGTGTAIGAGASVQRDVLFKFFTGSTGGTRLWSETQTVAIVDGDFNVLLGNGTPVAGEVNPASFHQVFATAGVYLGVTLDVGNDGLSNDSEITPRQQLVTTPFAFRAKVAESVDNLAITSQMLAGGSVTTNQLGSAAVTELKLASDAVTTLKIAPGAVENSDLALNAVTSDRIVAGAVGNSDLATNAVTSGKILDGTIALADLADSLRELLVPTGTIQAFGGTTAPAGWFLCDGSSKSRTIYSGLYAVIGNSFGTGGSTVFNVPDLRGQFLRGVSGGSSKDPEKTTRTAMKQGGATGNAVGSVQDSAVERHNHTLFKPTQNQRAGGTGGSYSNRENPGDTVNSGSGEYLDGTALNAWETRPTNAYVNFIIKY